MKTLPPDQLTRIISVLDLTSLDDDDDEARIEALCAQACTPYGSPAALCIQRRFLPLAHRCLSQAGLRPQVRLASVANFPDGASDARCAVRDIEAALDQGADEVDLVMPWRALLQGDASLAAQLVQACRRAASGKTLKVILESGELQSDVLVRQATRIAIDAGADFIKTSTGKASVHATPQAARVMLHTLAQHNPGCGFKAAGGIREPAQAQHYLHLAASILGPAWPTPERFRLGASSLLARLIHPDQADPSGY